MQSGSVTTGRRRRKHTTERRAGLPVIKNGCIVSLFRESGVEELDNLDETIQEIIQA